MGWCTLASACRTDPRCTGLDGEDAAIIICGDHRAIVVKHVIVVVLGNPDQAPASSLIQAFFKCDRPQRSVRYRALL